MNYRITFSKQATKFFKKLPKKIQKRLKDKFKDIGKEPTRYLMHYEGDYLKIRIGDYRILADIDNEKKNLFVRVFDKRERIYKR